MAETDIDTEQQGFQGAGPLLVSAAAGAVAGAIAVIARKALSGSDGEREHTSRSGGSGGSGSSKGGTSFDDVDKVADDLEKLVAQLRSESRSSGNSPLLVEIADTISEYADQAAGAFHAGVSGGEADDDRSERRVTDELMSRISEITSGENEKQSGGSGSAKESKTKAHA